MSEFKRASWSRRFIAYTIDNIIVELFWIVLIAGLIIFTPADVSDIFDIIDPENELGLGNEEVGQILTLESSSNIGSIIFGYATVVPFRFLYWIYYEYKRGQTIGKRMMQIKTIKIDGSDQDLMSIIILTACKTSLIPFDVLFGVLFFRGKKERVSNRFTNTIVVSD